MGMTCARTGWRVERSARVMNRASRSFNLRNVLRFIKVVSLTGPARESFGSSARPAPSEVPLDNTQTGRLKASRPGGSVGSEFNLQVVTFKRAQAKARTLN